MIKKNINLFASMHLKNKLFLLFSLLTASVIIIISIVSYRIFSNEIQSVVTDYVSATLGQASDSLDSYMQEIDSIVNSLLIDKEFCASLRKNHESSYQKAILQKNVQSRLQAVSKVKHHIGNMYIVTKDGQFYTNNISTTANSYILSQNWFDQIYTQETRIVIPPNQVGTYSGVSSKVMTGQYFAIIYPAREIGQHNIFGAIGVEIKIDVLNQMFQYDKSSPYQGSMMVLDRDGQIIYTQHEEKNEQLKSEDKEKILQQEYGSYITKIGDTSMLVIFENCEKFPWTLVKFIPMEAILSAANNLLTVIWAIGILALVILMGVSYYLADKITRPLYMLQKKIQLVEMGNLDIDLQLKQHDEIYELANSFSNMLLRLKQSLAEIYETERQKRELEINLLQHQIYPHFLYNTLDSINWLARMQNAKSISQMLTALNRMLRMSIYNGDEMNTIQDELTVVQSFMVLQKLGYHQSIEIIYNIDDTLLECLIPKLTLQPLIENAILHGFEKSKDNAKIILSIQQQEDNHILLSVEDNGKGFSTQELEHLQIDKIEKPKRFSGIGIQNINQRLKLYFHGEGNLSFESIPDQKTVAKIVIPIWRNSYNDKGTDCRG